MSLKPSLIAGLSQQLRMTPQLQQAIRMLQLSSIDLALEIQEALDSNLMLEEVDSSLEEDMVLEDMAPEKMTPEKIATKDITTEDLPVDTSWDDAFNDTFADNRPGSQRSDDFEPQNAAAVTIQTHLLEQINLLTLTDRDRFIALSIIDGINEEGVLEVQLEEILESAPDEWQLPLDEIEAVLHLIQHLDPVGVAASSLRDCLSIQLNQLPTDTPFRHIALAIVSHHLGLLASRDYAKLSRKLRLRENQLRGAIALIQSLNPRPGSNIATSMTDYIKPDVIVSKQNGKWLVELNTQSAPRIRINSGYAALIGQGANEKDTAHLKSHLQEAKWFIKSLQQRNSTLLRVATKIVEHQKAFLEYGDRAMKPLVLHDIATALELHESTISRVTTQKYIHTPGGVYELKYFFSSHVNTYTGGEVSSTAIKALIKKLVAEENPRKPLSDEKIARLLEAQNINVARRTVAKYRELLLMPPSNERKELI